MATYTGQLADQYRCLPPPSAQTHHGLGSRCYRARGYGDERSRRAGLRFIFEELIHEERRAIPHRKGIVLEPVAEDDETLVVTQC